jgi:hypothetical protein
MSLASPPLARRRERRRLAIALASVLGALVAITTACSNQGEGERCEFENNNADCKTDEGLVCYPAAQLNASSDRCCPRDRSKATDPICKAAVSGSADATPPPDTGPTTPPDASGASDASDANDGAEGDASDAGQSDAADATDQ